MVRKKKGKRKGWNEKWRFGDYMNNGIIQRMDWRGIEGRWKGRRLERRLTKVKIRHEAMRSKG